MAREARVEDGVTVGFWGTVFEDAFLGGEQECGGVEVGFGAEGEELRLRVGVLEGWGEGDGCGRKGRRCGGGCHCWGGHLLRACGRAGERQARSSIFLLRGLIVGASEIKLCGWFDWICGSGMTCIGFSRKGSWKRDILILEIMKSRHISLSTGASSSEASSAAK